MKITKKTAIAIGVSLVVVNVIVIMGIILFRKHPTNTSLTPTTTQNTANQVTTQPSTVDILEVGAAYNLIDSVQYKLVKIDDMYIDPLQPNFSRYLLTLEFVNLSDSVVDFGNLPTKSECDKTSELQYEACTRLGSALTSTAPAALNFTCQDDVDSGTVRKSTYYDNTESALTDGQAGKTPVFQPHESKTVKVELIKDCKRFGRHDSYWVLR